MRITNVRNWLVVAGLVLLTPMMASGQDATWTVDLHVGGVVPQEASSLESGAFVGLDALFHVTDRLKIGPTAEYVRTETDGAFFPQQVAFGADSSRVFETGQRISVLQFGGIARFELMPDERFNPYVMGGAGGYTLYLETQSNDGFSRVTDVQFQFGGGVHWAVSDAAGVQIDVRDVVYTNFDRSALDPINPGPGVMRLDPDPSLPDAEETVHNIRFSIGLSYVPGLN